ncbi:MAG: energy-coupling factor transporter transmembrane protein EcfT [Spirochaetales bacterium]|nr:energy-coupling factor transporter transmembrane protein EcfT [Spirochaetales bacterium]
MGRPLLFHYQPRSDFLSRLPALSKLVGALSFSFVVTQGPFWVLAPSSLLLAALWVGIRAPLSALWRPVPVLLVLGILSLSPLLGGSPPRLVLVHAGIQTLRVALLFEAGHLLTLTTSPGQIAQAVRQLARPWGRLKALQAAALVSLTISAIPGILDRAAGVKDAALLRGVKPRPSLIMVNLWTIVLLRVLLTRGAETAQALELRGWGGSSS